MQNDNQKPKVQKLMKLMKNVKNKALLLKRVNLVLLLLIYNDVNEVDIDIVDVSNNVEVGIEVVTAVVTNIGEFVTVGEVG